MGRKEDTPWTDAMVAQITARWAAGQTASQIAKALGVSRNAVIGKAHRLHLAARPSPLHAPDPLKRQRPYSSLRSGTMPKLVNLTPVAAVPVVEWPALVIPAPMPTPAPIVAPVPVLTPPVAAPATVVFRRPPKPCCYLYGTRGKYRPCEDNALPGKSYCEPHHLECVRVLRAA